MIYKKRCLDNEFVERNRSVQYGIRHVKLIGVRHVAEHKNNSCHIC